MCTREDTLAQYLGMPSLRWCHESQWTTLVFEWFRYLYVRVLNPHCSKCVWRSLYVEGLSVHYLYKYFNLSYLSFWCDVKRYRWDPNTGQVRYSNVLPIPYSNGVILNVLIRIDYFKHKHNVYLYLTGGLDYVLDKSQD